MQNSKIRTILGSVCLILFLYSKNAPANELTGVEIAENADEATVFIVTEKSGQSGIGLGSGFFVTPNLIATNLHVVHGVLPSDIVFKRVGQEEFQPIMSVRYQDRNHDLAVLRVLKSRVKPLYLGNSDTVKKGETVYVAGNPRGLEATVSKGIVSGQLTSPGTDYKAFEFVRKGVKLIQIDAPISSGSSGGPVMNDRGEVIGVATVGSVVADAQNLNFAIPSKHLKSLLTRHGVRLPSKPKRRSDNRDLGRKNEEKAKVEAERAKADAKKAEAEAEKAKAEKVKAEAEKAAAEARKVEAEARKAEAEARRVEAERAKAEAEKAKAESKIAEAERTKKEAEDTKESKAEVEDPIARIADRLQAATVLIFGMDRNGIKGLVGSGFFVRKNQVATDSHVIDGSKLIEVKRVGQGAHSSDPSLDAQLLKTDRAHHLAILQVKGADVQPLPLANSEEVDIGQKIFLVGNPVREEFSDGEISYITEMDGVRYFQFYAPVSPGSSGGPIVNAKGEVIAVNALNVGGITNAIPSNYLAELLEGEGDPQTQPTEPPTSSQGAEDDSKTTPTTPYLPKRLLEQAIELYEKSRFPDAIEHLESALNGLHNPQTRAIAHLYLGFSKWGLAETESSVNADFREALRYNPDLELPPRIGENHPVFKPLLELVRRESLGTLTVSASPPETEIWLFGGEMKRRLLGAGTASIRLFKGTYAVEGVMAGAHKVVPVLITPDDHEKVSLVMETEVLPSHEFELTLDIFSTEKPKKVVVYYTMYDTSGNQLGLEEKKEMQLQEQKPESSIWVYHVTLPSADQGGRIVYRIEADGKVIRDEPIQVQILEPPDSAFFEVQDTIPVKARVVSAAAIRDVRVYYDAPGKLSKNSPSKLLKRESDSNTYIGEIPSGRKHTDTWLFVAAVPEKGIQSRSTTRSVRAKMTDEPVNDEEPPEDLSPPPPPLPHQGVWASHSWSNHISDDGFYSGWERGNVVSLAYLQEGKGFQTLGVQLDYTYDNPDYVSAMAQWGPSTRENPVAFAFLAGVTGYRSSDPSFSRVRQSRQFTPLIGGSFKLYPLDRVVVDATASVKLQSENGAADKESSFTNDFLHHYEAGIRLYISPTLNLRAGYGRWRLGEYDNASVQVGLGATF